MGNNSSTIKRTHEGHKIDPSRDPVVFHLIETGSYGRQGDDKRAEVAINRSLSRIKVCRSEFDELEIKLRKEYFEKWDENCDVAEFNGFSREKFDDLLDKINDRFSVTGNDIRSKLRGIQLASEWTCKMYEFTFGRVVDSGTVYFGMIVLGMEKVSGGDSFDAVTCLYKLDYVVAKVKVRKRKPKRTLGFRTGTHRRDWWESKSLDFITKNALTNFCRIKALDAFHKQGLVSSINEVSSLEDVD